MGIHDELFIQLLCRSQASNPSQASHLTLVSEFISFFCVNIFTTSSCVGVSTNNTGGSLVDHAFHFLFPHFPTCMFV